MEHDDESLDRRIGALPREVEPPRDLWPDVRAAIGRPALHARRTRVLQVAAAAMLFLAGWLVGQYTGPAAPQPVAAGRDPLAAAAAVQRAGTAYVAALAEVRTSRGAERGDVLAQARDAAIAAVEGAAWELTQMSEDAAARAIFEIAERDRRAK